MCWTSKIKPVYEIAKEDIVVYKSFCKDDFIYENSELVRICSFHRAYPYEVNKINKSIRLNHHFGVSGHYHVIDEGYHSYEKMSPQSLYAYLKIGLRYVKCIIPKGSTYVINQAGEVVSSNIIVTNEVMDYDAHDIRKTGGFDLSSRSI